ncbi:MAG: nicotinate phosphoribosyltransferase, partial [Gammaproteobacteria bacterium]
ISGDIVSLADSPCEGRPLLELVMKNGRLVKKLPLLEAIRGYTGKQLGALPDSLKVLKDASVYPVSISSALTDLTESIDRGKFKQ